MIVVYGDSEAGVRDKLAADPSYANDVLKLESVKRWEMFIVQRGAR